MPHANEIIPQIFAAADGEIVGRIRLQKIVYLLEQVGMGAGLKFAYHHYGPFSRAFADALEAKVALHELDEHEKATDYGTSYSIFRMTPLPPTGSVGNLDYERARALIMRLKREPSVILELAATIHWLREKEQHPDWKAELRVRKTLKATDANIGRAEGVLRSLDLAA